MSTSNIVSAFIGAIIIGVVGLGFASVKAMVARAIKQMDQSMISMKEAQDKMMANLNAFQLDAAKHYATIPNLEKAERENTCSHATIHGRIDGLSKDLVRVDTIQGKCKTCQGD